MPLRQEKPFLLILIKNNKKPEIPEKIRCFRFFVRDSGQLPMGKEHMPYGKEAVPLYIVRVEVKVQLSLIDRMIILRFQQLLP